MYACASCIFAVVSVFLKTCLDAKLCTFPVSMLIIPAVLCPVVDRHSGNEQTNSEPQIHYSLFGFTFLIFIVFKYIIHAFVCVGRTRLHVPWSCVEVRGLGMELSLYPMIHFINPLPSFS